MPSRRHFCQIALAAALDRALVAQTTGDRETSRPNVAAVDRAHILATSEAALKTQPSLDLRNGTVPALAAGCVLLRSETRAQAEALRQHALAHLRYLFAQERTRLNNSLTETNHPEDVVALAPLGEIAQAIPFVLEDADSDLRNASNAWFSGLLQSLRASRTGGLARDHKDHVSGVWLFVAAASARLCADEQALADLRHFYKGSVVRAQILADGTLPHDLATRNPYRNSLFALDLLAGSVDLLSTRFESLWTFELQDGPGMRAAVARHAPWIQNRSIWPYLADQSYFHDLPCRRTSLLLAARAYERPEYATIWRELGPAEPTVPELLDAFPIRQPLLWTARSHA